MKRFYTILLTSPAESGSLIGENALPWQPGVKISANAPDDIKMSYHINQ